MRPRRSLSSAITSRCREKNKPRYVQPAGRSSRTQNEQYINNCPPSRSISSPHRRHSLTPCCPARYGRGALRGRSRVVVRYLAPYLTVCVPPTNRYGFD
ncbi:hypothetical protein M1M40_gp08 [Halorubrum tailed virus 29]|uniref:Uncharacterized protein n=1 Tax=Halorubrum tailed virus 29 TaxID=2878010 RepID=A0AAE8Y0P9_9CAUD|nr:hypothetical protein M1M40_gp08 [Halorubrum tailed virus 29]UBF23286.1 hypothetical protein HRTV-29_gp8 [Halorubrum tailed virus 29]